jgi:hypothetical protein
MIKVKAVANDDYAIYPRTWTKGETYEIVFSGPWVFVRSNQSEAHWSGPSKDNIYDMFDWEGTE